jgi:hypothetical protein
MSAANTPDRAIPIIARFDVLPTIASLLPVAQKTSRRGLASSQTPLAALTS